LINVTGIGAKSATSVATDIGIDFGKNDPPRGGGFP